MSFATVSCKSVFILFHTPFKTLVYPTQNRQSKVFAAMIEQQKTSVEAAKTDSRFAELPAPTRLLKQTSSKDTYKQNKLAASVRTGNISIDICSCADTDIVSTFCKALCHAGRPGTWSGSLHQYAVFVLRKKAGQN